MEAEVIKTDPEFPFTRELINDNIASRLIIKFEDDYVMLINVKFTITLQIMDLAGNEATVKYSFTTMMAEEEG